MKTPERYHYFVILLHWVMALGFILMLASGLVMENVALDKALQFQLIQWHKSLGVLLLLALILRIVLRIMTTKPPMPQSLSARDRSLAHLWHHGIYVWMITLPVSGWIVVSSSVYGLPTIVFGWFTWPHIPTVAANSAIHAAAEISHQLLAYSFLALIIVHVAAVIKHAWFDRINLLPRMGIGRKKT